MTEEESSEQELDSDESEGTDWSDLEREAAESDEERSDNDERSDDGIELGQKECGNFFVSKCRSWSHLIWRWCIFPLIVACKYVQNQTFFKRTPLELVLNVGETSAKLPHALISVFSSAAAATAAAEAEAAPSTALRRRNHQSTTHPQGLTPVHFTHKI